MANSGTKNPPPVDARPAEALALGTKLQNQRFAVGKVLGRGGFGISYMGRDHQLGRLVAIKELFPVECLRRDLNIVPSQSFSAAKWDEARTKFLAEARTLARFRHDGIVQVFDCFEENDTAYLVMEYLQGQTLQQLVDERGVLPQDEALRFVSFLGQALQDVHDANIIHRDIKPENIISCEAPATSGAGAAAAPRVVLIDFGLNKQVIAPTSSYGTQQLTRTTALGSPGFAAPEQYGQSANLGVFTDIYGLASTLYFLLTAHVPLSAVERINQTLPPVQALNSKIAPHVSDAVASGMAMNATERPASVEAWLQMLTAAPQAATTRTSLPHQGTTVLAQPGAPANSPVAPAQPTNAALEVRVSARVLFWPLLCACCGKTNDSISRAVQTNRQGQRYIRGEVNEWLEYRDDFYCGNCRSHFQLNQEVQRKTGELEELGRQSSSQLAIMNQQSSARIQAEEKNLAMVQETVVKARDKRQSAESGETNIKSIVTVGMVSLVIGAILCGSLLAGLLVSGACVVAGEIWRVLTDSQRRQTRVDQAQNQLVAAEQTALSLQQHLDTLRRQEAVRVKQQEAALRQSERDLQHSLSADRQQMASAMSAICTCDDTAQSVRLTSSYGAQRTFNFSNAAFAREFESLNHEKLIYTG